MGKWEMVRLGEHIEQIRGVSYKPEDAIDKNSITHTPILRAHNIQNDGLNDNNLIYVNTKRIKQHQYILKGDIVVCASSGSKDLVGKAAQAVDDMPVSFGAFCKVVRPRKTIESAYLKHYFSSPFYRFTISELSAGANINNLRNEHIDELRIPLPPLPIQQKIADILDRASVLIEKRKAQIEKLDLLVKSQFVELFGDPVTNPMGWEMKQLGDECDIITGNTPPRIDKDNYGDFLEWIKSDNINTPDSYLTTASEYISEHGFTKCRYVEKGCILMTCIAGSLSCIGNVAVSDRRVAFNQQINAIVPNKNHHWFIYWMLLLSKPHIHTTVNMSLKGILSKSKLSEMVFAFPPLPLQSQFAVFVERVEAQKARMKQGLALMDLEYMALMQKCFKGEMFNG